MTPEEKQAAKDNLRVELSKLSQETMEHWLSLFEADEEQRKHSGYSKGSEDMIQKLVKDYRKRQANLMKPFDRGDYD